MTVEELKEEAQKLGYKIVKKPPYNCTCYNDPEWSKAHRKKCKDAVFLGKGTQGCTHCFRKDLKQ